jgi:ATP adenylyltransferase
MQRLWAPWRLPYVTEASGSASACIFCDACSHIETDPLVVHRGPACFVILNKFPYNNGHLMVVPYRHLSWLGELNAVELAEVAALMQAAERVLTEAYHPHGFNIGVNLGKAAGAGVINHVHLHVVPRWNGDTNFMSVVGETRVLPEELSAAADRIRRGFALAQAT